MRSGSCSGSTVRTSKQRRRRAPPGRTPTGCRRGAGPRTPPGPPSSRPRPTTASSCRASTRRPPPTAHLRTCAPSRSPSSDSASRCARLDRSSSGSVQHPVDGQLVLAAGRVHRQDRLQRGDLQLVHPHGAGDRVLPQPGDHVGAADHDPGLRPAEQLVARARHQVGAVGERLGHRRLVRRHPVLVMQQPGADVEDERHAALRGERGEVLGRR